MPHTKHKNPRQTSMTPEELDAMGQESDTKAAKWVIEKSNEQEKIEAEEKAEQLDILEHKRKYDRFSYQEKLAIFLRDMLREEGFPTQYGWVIELEGKAICLAVYKRDGSFKQIRKFRVTGEPKYDRQACVVFSSWAGDLVLREVDKSNELITPV